MADEERSAANRHGRAAGLAAARHAFYRGDIANKIAEYHKLNNGWLTLEDLAEFRVSFEPPVHTRYNDVDLYCCGPWCQGPVLSQSLNILEKFDLKGFGHNSLDYIHTVIETLKLSYSDRDRYFGDPRFVEVPIDRLLSKEYAGERANMIDDARAWAGMPPSGTFEHTEPALKMAASLVDAGSWTDPDPDTSHIAVVDRHGNCFSATPSDGALTSPVVPGTGIVPSTRGGQSWTDPAHPACLAPKKRPRLTPCPAMAIRQNRWFMPFGSPGNDVQPQAMLQVFLNMFLFDMLPQVAIDQPRFATYCFPRSSEPHEYFPGRLSLESRLPDDTVSGLSARGHDVTLWPDYEWRAGCVSVVFYDRETGVLEGGTDVRRPGGIATL
jgi:gamma-glutamyltranspeptidase/glutathione hydrolase